MVGTVKLDNDNTGTTLNLSNVSFVPMFVCSIYKKNTILYLSQSTNNDDSRFGGILLIDLLLKVYICLFY